MATLEELQALLERIEGATGADREIDGAIAVALRDLKPTIKSWAKENFPSWSSDSTGRVFGIHEDGTLGPNWFSDHYTASIDAAVALVGRMLPRWGWSVSGYRCIGGHDVCFLHPSVVEDVISGNGATPPLAILAALLKALIAQKVPA